jgi:hypothetical protein
MVGKGEGNRELVAGIPEDLKSMDKMETVYM